MSENRKLLDLLQHRPGEYISGEELSRRLKISRTAIWKQINKLRDEGYQFEAVSRRGYRLLSTPDKLVIEDIQSNLNTSVFGQRLVLVDVTPSTQMEARDLAEDGMPSGTVVIAEEQTAGRGRQGRKWFSPPRQGVWMSLIVKPNRPLSFAPQLTLLTAVAVCRAIRNVTGVETGIKWPNDLLIDGQKVCGILIESASEDGLIKYCVAGIGINVNIDAEDIPEELKHIITSLKIAASKKISRSALISEVMNQFEQLYHLYEVEGFPSIAQLWEALSVTLGQRIRVTTPSGVKEGIAAALDLSGALIVVDDLGKEHAVHSGEIQFCHGE